MEDKLSWPESDSEPESELELELLELDESELESDAWPEGCSRSTRAATAAKSGISLLRTRSHFLLSFGRPRTVLCQTTGKLVREQKLWVTATVASRFRTTCQ